MRSSTVRRAGKEHGAEENTMAVELNLDALLDSAYKNAALSEISAAPVSARGGLSDGDAELLRTAFNIRSSGILARASTSESPAGLVAYHSA
jgi:hypothetical protein